MVSIVKYSGQVAMRRFILLMLTLFMGGLNAQLNQNCTVTILNRSVQADSSGNWLLTNIPTGFGPVRGHAVCSQNGKTQFGKTGAYSLTPNGVVGFDSTIQLGPNDSTPSGLIIAPSSIQVTAERSLSNPSRIGVASASLTGSLSDTYQWNHYEERLDSRAAPVQAGYGSVGNGGSIFKTEVKVDTVLLMPTPNVRFQ